MNTSGYKLMSGGRLAQVQRRGPKYISKNNKWNRGKLWSPGNMKYYLLQTVSQVKGEVHNIWLITKNKHQKILESRVFQKLNKQRNIPQKLTRVLGCVRIVEWILTNPWVMGGKSVVQPMGHGEKAAEGAPSAVGPIHTTLRGSVQYV